MKIVLVIPWRETPQRIKPLQKVLSWYEQNFSDFVVVLSDSDGERFNLSRARNLGVERAKELGANIIVLNDADTIPEGTTVLKETIDAAMKDNLVHNPYTEYRFYNINSTNLYFQSNSFMSLPFHASHTSNAGIWVFKPSSWDMVGGMDEKFVGWGYEDTAFERAHETIHGFKLVKHKGVIHAFDHERDPDVLTKPTQDVINNFNLYSKYLTITNPKTMLEFVKSK